MCGITLTTCSKYIKNENRVKPEALFKMLKSKNKHLIKNIYKLCFDYKSDVNFINFFRLDSERRKIKDFIKILNKNISENIKLKYKDEINDINWFLGGELDQRYDFVKKIISNKSVPNSTKFYIL